MKGIKKFKGTEMQLYEFIYSLSGDSDSSSVQIQLEGKIKDIFKICDALESTQIFYSLDLRKIISFEGNFIDVGYQPPFSFRNLDFLKELYPPLLIYRHLFVVSPNLQPQDTLVFPLSSFLPITNFITKITIQLTYNDKKWFPGFFPENHYFFL